MLQYENDRTRKLTNKNLNKFGSISSSYSNVNSGITYVVTNEPLSSFIKYI